MIEVQVNFKSSAMPHRHDSPAATAAATAATTADDTTADTVGWLPIGQVARRAGVAASAVRFYEQQGLIAGARSAGGRRIYPRHVLRRIGFIRAAQTIGLGLEEVRAALATLPAARTPTKADWARLSRHWAPRLDERVAALQRLRSQLDSCIGCGCLSLKSCALYNPQDAAGRAGTGARFLVAERAARRRTPP